MAITLFDPSLLKAPCCTHRTGVIAHWSNYTAGRDNFTLFLLLWPWPWPGDLHMQTWPVFFQAVPAEQKWTFTSRLSKVIVLHTAAETIISYLLWNRTNSTEIKLINKTKKAPLMVMKIIIIIISIDEIRYSGHWGANYNILQLFVAFSCNRLELCPEAFRSLIV